MLVVQVTVSLEQYLINCMENLAIIWTFVVLHNLLYPRVHHRSTLIGFTERNTPFVSPCPPECYLQSETKIEPDLRLRSQLRFSLPSIIITITSNEPWNTESTKRIEIRQSQTMTFWTRWSKLLFPKRCAKMIDGSEKRKRQLAFELQNSSVYEKRSNFCDFQKVPSIQHW